MRVQMLDGKVVVTAVAVAALTFVATRDSGANREGRQPGQYQVVTDGSAIFRLNTSTGEVVVCVPARGRPPQVTCGLEAAERTKVEEAARRFEEEMARRGEGQTGR